MSDWEFSTTVIDKARDLSVSPKEGQPGVFVVKSGANSYRVQTDFDADTRKVSWAMCGCRHGINNSGRARCSHVVAVLLWWKENA